VQIRENKYHTGQCFPNFFFSRTASASNNETTNPHILPDANIEYPHDRYPKLKIYNSEMISGSYEYVTVTYVTIHFMI
jgi:hypothetical protein